MTDENAPQWKKADYKLGTGVEITRRQGMTNLVADADSVRAFVVPVYACLTVRSLCTLYLFIPISLASRISFFSWMPSRVCSAADARQSSSPGTTRRYSVGFAKLERYAHIIPRAAQEEEYKFNTRL